MYNVAKHSEAEHFFLPIDLGSPQTQCCYVSIKGNSKGKKNQKKKM